MDPPLAIVDRLEEHYTAVEEYCNARTQLSNAVIGRPTSSSAHHDGLSTAPLVHVVADYHKAVDTLQQTHHRMREDVGQLQGNRVDLQVLERHVALADRVVAMVSNPPPLHANGVVQPTTNNDNEQSTVALSSLRASLRRVKQTLDVPTR